MAAAVAGFLTGDGSAECDRAAFAEAAAVAARHDWKTASMVCQALRAAEERADPAPVYDRHRGWAAHEAVAAGLFAAARHVDDPAAGMLEAANTAGDSDSLAGALLGARNGLSALLPAWVRDVERSGELLDSAGPLADLIYPGAPSS